MAEKDEAKEKRKIKSVGKMKEIMTTYYIEAKIRFPRGHGLWGAWWATRKYEDGQPYQEFDTVEQLGKDPFSAYATFHQPDSGSLRVTRSDEWTDQFHVYGGAVWPGHAEWFYDGVKVREWNNASISAYPMYVILQMAVGGSWAGSPDGSWSEVATLVDYVRVWTP